MIKKQFKVIGETGFARTACLIVSYATKFKAKMVLEYRGISVNLKDSPNSIMDVMSLGIRPGDYFSIITYGRDECHAIRTIETFLCKNHLAKGIFSNSLTVIKESGKHCCCG